MRNALLIAGREMRAYLRSPLGYIVAAAVLLIDGIWIYTGGVGVSGAGLGTGKSLSADVLANFFYGASGTTMTAAIFLAMRLIAEERQTGTMVLLNTAPVRDVEIVAGKFLSALGMIAVLTALTAYMPALIFVHGKVSLGHIAVGYLGVLLLGAAALAIGLFASALARSQVVAVILGAALLGTMILLWLVARVTDPPLQRFLSAAALHHEHFRGFMTGVLALDHVVYYLSVSFVFLLGATKVLEARRWR